MLWIKKYISINLCTFSYFFFSLLIPFKDLSCINGVCRGLLVFCCHLSLLSFLDKRHLKCQKIMCNLTICVTPPKGQHAKVYTWNKHRKPSNFYNGIRETHRIGMCDKIAIKRFFFCFQFNGPRVSSFLIPFDSIKAFDLYFDHKLITGLITVS